MTITMKPLHQIERISVDEMHARMRAQGVSSRDHIAFKCVMCSTVQSIASLQAAGAPAEKAERQIGFSCEGRWRNAGPWPASETSQRKRTVRGCDWTLGGLFRLHKLEVETEDGSGQASFVLATPEEAKALEAEITAMGERDAQ